MAYRGINGAAEVPFAAQNTPRGKQFHPDLNSASDGFDLWWKKTFAQHTAVVAEASALVRAHRRVRSVGESRIGPAL